MRVLITGFHGFIGKNLDTRLKELSDFEVNHFGRNDSFDSLQTLIDGSDAVIHLAGENRPADVQDFQQVNTELTRVVCECITATGRAIPLIFSSSIQAQSDNPYGKSKREAESIIENWAADTGGSAIIYRFPGVFGKWCRPNYNSVVATFCHNIANDLPIQINDPNHKLTLVYIDDLVNELIKSLARIDKGAHRAKVNPEYSITLGCLADQIYAFKNCRTSLVSENVGTGLTRALYATYISYLPVGKFIYDIPQYSDARGSFVEMLKTKDAGQFSYFTAFPGVVRGGHYHHTKTEKFLVIKGKALFRFRHISTEEEYEVITSGEQPQIVETIPGWAHDITNIGDEEMVVMLWANEIFDRERPDTVACKV